MYHVPMCKVCGEWEVGTFFSSEYACSERCDQELWDAFYSDLEVYFQAEDDATMLEQMAGSENPGA